MLIANNPKKKKEVQLMTLANKKNTRVHFIFSGHKSLLTRNIFFLKKTDTL